MSLCQCLEDPRAPKAPTTIVIALVVALLGSFLPLVSFGAVGRALDNINGDPGTTLDWSEGEWSVDDVPLPGCVTFGGGVGTGPGDFVKADSVTCTEVPNGWSWNVTVPGPFTLYYDFNGIPPGYIVCGQVFSVPNSRNVQAEVWLENDWMRCTDLDTDTVLWEGEFSTFDPEYMGWPLIAATRCGRVRVIPTGACCNLETGACTVLTEEECNRQTYPHLFQGADTTCDPNPCPQPPGACCYPDGHCEYVMEAQCPTGDWRVGVPCDPNPCRQPLGACCYPDGHCEYVEQAQCPTGDWRDGMPCDPNPCPPPVPVQETDWGRIKAHYR